MRANPNLVSLNQIPTDLPQTIEQLERHPHQKQNIRYKNPSQTNIDLEKTCRRNKSSVQLKRTRAENCPGIVIGVQSNSLQQCSRNEQTTLTWIILQKIESWGYRQFAETNWCSCCQRQRQRVQMFADEKELWLADQYSLQETFWCLICTEKYHEGIAICHQ